ncbi:hypothetical protein BGZ57DRAFT_865252 [Hyaloscypha finlandica]|nr:hypothetical protein BGZ57DRAFT_865252 [Hyaloscypha finlandica]
MDFFCFLILLGFTFSVAFSNFFYFSSFGSRKGGLLSEDVRTPSHFLLQTKGLISLPTTDRLGTLSKYRRSFLGCNRLVSENLSDS